MSERPMVNVYEGEPEKLVYRPMNDAEFAQWELDQAAAADAEAAVAADQAAAEVAAAQPTFEEKLAGVLEALPDGPLQKSDLAGVIAALQAA